MLKSRKNIADVIEALLKKYIFPNFLEEGYDFIMNNPFSSIGLLIGHLSKGDETKLLKGLDFLKKLELQYLESYNKSDFSNFPEFNNFIEDVNEFFENF